jgi:DNA-directed RNA polymerase specialized sigma24 family protein
MSDLNLNIRLDHVVPTGINARAVVEVFDTNLQSVLSESIAVNTTNLFSLPHGRYLVQVKLPSGKVLRNNLLISSGAPRAEIVFSTPHGPPKDLSWQYYLGYVPDHSRALPQQSLEGAWVRVWSFDVQGWRNEAWPGSPLRVEDATIIGRLQMPRDRLMLLQIGGEHVPWRFIALPPAPDEIEIVIRYTRKNQILTGGLAVRLTAGDGTLDALLGYEAGGATLSASVLWKELSTRALEYASRKVEDANGAALALYYLGATQQLKNYVDWTDDFVKHYPWLADAWVISAMGSLITGDREGARKKLHEAARRGVPVYRRGLRFLQDQMSASRSMDEKKADESLEYDIQRIATVAAATEWSQPYTTFYGASPSQPSGDLVYGVPGNADFVLLGTTHRESAQLTKREVRETSGSEIALWETEQTVGSAHRFDELHSMYQREVLGYLRARCARKEDAEDIAQLTWKVLWEKISQYDPKRANFAAFAKYWAGLQLLQWYDRWENRPQVTLLFSEIEARHADLEPDATVDEILARAGKIINTDIPSSMEAAENYRNLLASAFGSHAPPHQLLAFGFCKILERTPRDFVSTFSEVTLDDMAVQFEAEYKSELPMQAAEIESALGALRFDLKYPLSAVLREPATYTAYRHLLERKAGDTRPRDYYQEAPEQSVSHWIYAVRRKVVRQIVEGE